jgi:hypothetical protein
MIASVEERMLLFAPAAFIAPAALGRAAPSSPAALSSLRAGSMFTAGFIEEVPLTHGEIHSIPLAITPRGQREPTSLRQSPVRQDPA